MKFKYLKAMMLLPVLGAFTSCQDNLVDAGLDGLQLDENGLATVSLNVTTEGVMGTRGEESTDPTQQTISTGKEVDKLIYAIYKKSDSEWKLLDYSDTPDDSESTQDEDSAAVDDEPSTDTPSTTPTKGEGQFVADFTADKTTCIILKLDPEATYKIACWAQSSKCKAYNTENLEEVKVDYSGASNNDETRDAFCGTEEFQGNARNVKVVLRRPFAQINVGTTGADYANTAKIPGGTYYQFSKMEFTNLADQLNVLTNVATKSIDADNKTFDGKATFGWATIPAWSYIDGYSQDNVPTLTTVTNGTYGDNKTFTGDAEVWAEEEEFLIVNLDENETDILGYMPEYNTKNKDGDYLTETFKYLSMSYVLVPSTTVGSDGNTYDDTADPSVGDDNKLEHGSTIGVTAYFNKVAEDTSTDQAVKVKLDLKNVPAARNWRTNILGGLFYAKTDDDPEDGPYDDPTSIFGSTHIDVVVVTNYFGNSTTTDVSKEVNKGDDDDDNDDTSSNWKNETNPNSQDDADVETGHESETEAEVEE